MRATDKRQLVHEMVLVQSALRAASTQLEPEALAALLRGVRLAAKHFSPLFPREPRDTLLDKYVAVQLSLALPPDDEGWSREVLDVSQRSTDPLEQARRGALALNRSDYFREGAERPEVNI